MFEKKQMIVVASESLDNQREAKRKNEEMME
jgi:hypothetical protein